MLPTPPANFFSQNLPKTPCLCGFAGLSPIFWTAPSPPPPPVSPCPETLDFRAFAGFLLTFKKSRDIMDLSEADRGSPEAVA